MKRISKKLLCLFVALTISVSIGGCKNIEAPEDGNDTNNPDATSTSTEKTALKNTLPNLDSEENTMIEATEEDFNVEIEEEVSEGTLDKPKVKAMDTKDAPDVTSDPVTTSAPVITSAPVTTNAPVVTSAPVATSTPATTSTPVVVSVPDATSASTEIPTLKMWNPDLGIEERAIMLGAIRAAEEKFNVKVEETETDSIRYRLNIKDAMATKGGPDIFYTWSSGFSQPFVNAGKALALDQYLGEAKDKLLTGITDSFTYDGKVYGVPCQIQVASLFCNIEIFEKYNVKIPETYEDLLTAVGTFSENGVTPIICGAKDVWPAMFHYNVLALRTAGSGSCNEALSGKVSFDSPEFFDAAEKFVELTEAGAFGANAISVSWDNANEGFAQGKGAMLFNGNWVTNNVSSEISKVNGKIAARKFPIIEGSKGSATEYLGGADNGYMINSETKDPELAAKVLLFICERVAHDMYESNMGLPSWKVQVDESKISPLNKEIFDMTKDSTGWTSWWDVVLESEDAYIHKNLVAGLLVGQITPEKFAKEMQKINVNRNE